MMDNQADVLGVTQSSSRHASVGGTNFTENVKLPFASYHHGKQHLVNLEAIDFFFAKEVMQALWLYGLTSQAKGITLQLQNNTSMIWHTFAALSESLRQGNSCLSLATLSSKQWAHDHEHIGFEFATHSVLNDIFVDLAINPKAEQLVVLKDNNLYMRRYYLFERDLKQSISEKLSTLSTYSTPDIAACLAQLFPQEATSKNNSQSTAPEIDWQKLAVANAINKKFSIIAGGPGTGKTYTVTKLLAALVMLNGSVSENKALNIALVAPTGKAAQRLSESLIKALIGFKDQIADEVLSLIPTEAKTIHRLLGVMPNSPNFKHDQHNTLDCNVLLIDEVSMVDLPMMTRIFRALKPETSVILLGDADQLPSVAVGSVLADLAPRPHYGYSEGNLSYLAQCCGLKSNDIAQHSAFATSSDNKSDYLSFLMKSRRFDGEGGIGKIAQDVIHGNAEQSWSLLKEASAELSWVNHDLTAWLTPLVNKYYKGISSCSDISDAFALLAKFRILCVMRLGEFGVDAINQWVKTYLISKATGKSLNESAYEASNLYHGLPIMITQNNYRLGLYNGDIGLIWQNEDNNRLVAYFEQSDTTTSTQPKVTTTSGRQLEATPANSNSFKQFLPSRLPSFESVYAMTIHKTQGSEFEHVALVLPKQKITAKSGNEQPENKLLSRELLYTGITRAKKHLTISTQKEIWEQGVQTQVKRDSGLYL